MKPVSTTVISVTCFGRWHVCEVTESGTCSVSCCVSLGRLGSRHWVRQGQTAGRKRCPGCAVSGWEEPVLSSHWHTGWACAAWWHQATQPPRRPSPWCFRGPCGTAPLGEDKCWFLLSATGRRASTPVSNWTGRQGRPGPSRWHRAPTATSVSWLVPVRLSFRTRGSLEEGTRGANEEIAVSWL